MVHFSSVKSNMEDILLHLHHFKEKNHQKKTYLLNIQCGFMIMGCLIIKLLPMTLLNSFLMIKISLYTVDSSVF